MKSRWMFLAVLLFVAALLSSAVFVGFQLYKGELYEQGREEANHSARHVSSDLSMEFSTRREAVELAAAAPQFARHGSGEQRAALQTFVNKTAFAGVSVIDSNGTMTNIAAGLRPAERRALVGQDFSNRTYYRQAMQGQTYISDPLAAESGNYIVTISTPIRRDGQVVGTLNAAYHLSDEVLAETATSMLESGDGITIYSQSGEVVYSEEPVSTADPIVRNASVGDSGWRVSVQQSRRDVESTVQTVSYLQAGSVLVVLLSITGFGWWVYRRNLRQVEHLLSGFQALEDREYGTRIDVSGGEEWQDIETSFNAMSQSLHQFETERKAREHSLRQFKRAVEHAGYAVFITDTQGTITYVNPAFEEITGYPEETAIGATPDILNSGKMSSEYFADLWSTLLSGCEWDRQIINRRRNGTLYFAHQTITPLTDDDGNVEEFVAIQSDITELKDRERHLQTLSRVLRHNLRNKMNVITGYAEILLDDSAVEETMPRQIIETGAELTDLAGKERRIVELLVDQPRLQQLTLQQTLDAVVAKINHEYPDRTIASTCPPGVEVEAIPTLQRALYELLENSIVHADQTRVTLTVEQHEETVEIHVADDGPGIPADERRILTGDADIEPLSHGSGLGLWLVHHIVRLSNGTVEYSEGPSGGCTVTIEVPRP